MKRKAVREIMLTLLLASSMFLVQNPVVFAQISFSDSFEGTTIDPFWTVTQQYGTVTLSSDQAHSGSQSVKMSSIGGGQREMHLSHTFPAVGKGIVSVWLYDTTPGMNTLYASLGVFNSALPYGTPGMGFQIAVMDWDPYWYHAAAWGIGEVTVARTLGWHKFKVVYNPGDAQFFIDGMLVASFPGDYVFDHLDLSVFGPSWRPDATFYFDDFYVQWAPPVVTATIDIDPDTLNLKSNGEFVTAYIELPAGYDAADIDLTTVQLEGIPAITDPKYSFVTDPSQYLVDHDGDGILERMVKFDRASVTSYVNMIDFGSETGKFKEVTLKIIGEVAEILFEGSDTVRVII